MRTSILYVSIIRQCISIEYMCIFVYIYLCMYNAKGFAYDASFAGSHHLRLRSMLGIMLLGSGSETANVFSMTSGMKIVVQQGPGITVTRG